jgi:hypothetical protein
MGVVYLYTSMFRRIHKLATCHGAGVHIALHHWVAKEKVLVIHGCTYVSARVAKPGQRRWLEGPVSKEFVGSNPSPRMIFSLPQDEISHTGVFQSHGAGNRFTGSSSGYLDRRPPSSRPGRGGESTAVPSCEDSPLRIKNLKRNSSFSPRLQAEALQEGTGDTVAEIP